jgi:hypothetical protein
MAGRVNWLTKLVIEGGLPTLGACSSTAWDTRISFQFKNQYYRLAFTFYYSAAQSLQGAVEG